MSNYPPIPQASSSAAGAENPQYNGVYTSAAQQYEPLPAESLQYTSAYPKVEAVPQDHTAPQFQTLQHDFNRQLQHQLHPQVAHVRPQSAAFTHSQMPQDHAKANRLRKACDSCSIRKVKCDESGPPCRACAALDIPCTFQRPSRRRGPPNRHAEAIKRQRLDPSADPPGPPANSSPTHVMNPFAVSHGHASPTHITAESICPLDVLGPILDDYFRYIYPVCPFPHHGSFQEAWKRREDVSNKPFLALMASMLCVFVAAYPHKARLQLKLKRHGSMFRDCASFVQRCQQVCVLARGPGYLDSDTLSVHDAATSYLLGLSGFYSMNLRQARLYFGECSTIIRALGLHRQQEGANGPIQPSLVYPFNVEREGIYDNVSSEVGRRVFWALFASAKTLGQFSSSSADPILPPPTPSEPYPPLPSELDDFCIFPAKYDLQPPGTIAITNGFNANVYVYQSYDALAVAESTENPREWDRQIRALQESLRQCKALVSQLPPALTIPSASDFAVEELPFSQPNAIHEASRDFLNPSHWKDPEASLESTRRMQHDIQRANLFASQLATRLFIVNKYLALRDSRRKMEGIPSSTPVNGTGLSSEEFELVDQEMRQEREDIAREVGSVLSNISQSHIEVMADSFILKLRNVAHTLLMAPESHQGPVALQWQGRLEDCIKILERLDRPSPPVSDSEPGEEDSNEIRGWA
ncbi:hypothetical protein K470DRAFT_259367 [Piedraia hortae CBS 480.64]|uniref:Zn(2)-C6 fungal-type domain-containing protein n=1 Tax=Piedraia hortae CBS 480.64 TaxID=1314780 RepID=A0A6A7BVV5_9PEZI|nr:hypothetical protein K470DRAFT_259367 [Piedraia hortae CBS 480.64]